jgi:hypothetical protein
LEIVIVFKCKLLWGRGAGIFSPEKLEDKQPSHYHYTAMVSIIATTGFVPRFGQGMVMLDARPKRVVSEEICDAYHSNALHSKQSI